MQRVDRCPACSGERVELVVAPGRFYCPRCTLAGLGPSDASSPPGEQLTLSLYAKPTS